MARAMVLVAVVWIVSSCMAAQVEVTVPLEHVDAADMPNWVANVAGAIGGGAARLAKTRVVARPAGNSVRVVGEAESVEWVKAIVAALDRPPRQVTFEIVFVRTRHADRLLGVPVTATLDVGGEAVEVPIRLIAAGMAVPRVAGARQGAGSAPTPDALPQLRGGAMCNHAFDPQTLAALLAEGGARKLAEPRLTVLDHTSGFVGFGPAPPAEDKVNEFGRRSGWPQSRSFSVRPMVRPDGRVVVEAGFTAADTQGGWGSLGVTWIAEPGVPVAVGAVPTAPDDDSVVYIVTCRVAEP